MNDEQFLELLENAPKNYNIIKYLMVMRNKLQQYKRIMVSYSGGSDSDIVLDLIELVKPDNCGEIKYVFFDTGLEWDATHRHRKEQEEKYGVTIEVHKPKVSIPLAVKRYGIPFFSKDVSEKIDNLQRHNFKWNNCDFETSKNIYPKCIGALKWWCCLKKSHNISKDKHLKTFLINFPPSFRISKKCCKYAKKDIAKEIIKTFKPDLQITGMRRAEGGARMGTLQSCFSESKDKKGYDEFRPLWFWSDKDKQEYKEWRNIKYSDCYEVWGMKRTGCVGCPFNSKAEQDLAIAQKYEPQKVKAAYAVFGQSYEYRRKYIEFKEKMKREAKGELEQQKLI